MKRLTTIGHRICIVLFALMLALPLLLFNREPGHASALENKTTARVPSLSDYDGLLDSRLPAALDDFVTDNIGLKEQGTLAHISLMYGLFHQVSITNFIGGKNGNTFFITKPILDTYQGLDVPSEDDLKQNEASLTELDGTVKDAGAQLVFMPIPNKEEIYPEEMPDEIHVVSDGSFLHTLKNRLIADGTVATVDTEQALLDAKKNGSGLLYFRNYDASHWNQNGMLMGYGALMETLHSRDASVTYLTREEVSVSGTNTHQAFSFLSSYPSVVRTFSSLVDTIYTVAPVNGYSGVSDNSVPAGFSLAGDSQNRYFHYHYDGAKNQKTLLVYGDSYVYSFMLPLLSETFSDVYFLAAGLDSAVVGELLQTVTPDYVVLECVARMVDAGRLQGLTDTLRAGIGTNTAAQSFASLPVLADECQMGFDDITIQSERAIHLSAYPDGLLLTGWAADPATDAGASAVFLRIGDSVMLTVQTDRPDLGSDACLHAGFQVTVPLSMLQSTSTVEVCAVNTAGDAALAPVELPVLP